MYGGDEDEDEDYELPEGAAARCPFVVEAGGLPAVRTDGAQVVYLVAEHHSETEGEDEITTVRVVDVATDRVDSWSVVVDGSDFPHDEDRCFRLWGRAQERAEALNQVLAKHQWRPMERLPVLLRQVYLYDQPEQRQQELDDRPPSDRPVEVIIEGEEAIVQVRGVEVLGRIPAPWEGVPTGQSLDEGCAGFDPIPLEVFGDRRTRVALIEVFQAARFPGGCFADTLYHPLVLEPGAFETIEARAKHVPSD